MRLITITAAWMLISYTLPAQTCHESGSEVHGMPPIGVMNGHTHGKGQWMASYRYMSMSMQGMSHQGQMLDAESVIEQGYMMSPETMRMDMHMLGVMYSPMNRLTLGVMANYNASTMSMMSAPSHEHGMSDHHHHGSDAESMDEMMELEESNMSNQGLGDIKISTLYRILVSPKHCLHSIVGMRLPTGNIDAGDQMHPVFPYGMQNGTGSFSAYLGLNYSWLLPKYLVGAQVLSTVPLHENNRNYMMHVTHELNVWGARKWTNWMSTSLRVRGYYQTAVRGMDAQISTMMSPLGNPTNQEFYLMEVMGGLNFMPLDQWRIAIEAGIPAHQWNEGVAMNRTWTATAGLQFMIH